MNLPGTDVSVSINMKCSYTHVSGATQLSRIQGIEAVLLVCFSMVFSISPDDFALKFPFFTRFLVDQHKFTFQATCTADLFDQQAKSALKEILQAVEEAREAKVCLMLMLTTTYLKQIVTNMEILRYEKVHALAELTRYVHFFIGFFSGGATVDMQARIGILDMFLSLFSLDFLASKMKLKSLTSTIDSFMVSCWINFETEHVLHLIVVVLAFLEMENEYKSLKTKVNAVLCLFPDKVQLSDSLPEIGHGVLNSICDDPCCLCFWTSLPDICSA